MLNILNFGLFTQQIQRNLSKTVPIDRGNVAVASRQTAIIEAFDERASSRRSRISAGLGKPSLALFHQEALRAESAKYGVEGDDGPQRNTYENSYQ